MADHPRFRDVRQNEAVMLICSVVFACLSAVARLDKACPFRVSIFRDFRSALYAAPLVSCEYHVCAYYVAEWRRFPFGPAVCLLGN